MAGLFEYDLEATSLTQHELGDTLIKTSDMGVPFTRALRKGKTQTNKIAAWPAHFPRTQGDIARQEGQDKTDGFGSNTPTPLFSIVQLNRSEGWKITDLAGMTWAAYAKTHALKVAQQKADDGDSFLVARERVLLSAQQPSLADGTDDNKLRMAGLWSLINPTQPDNAFAIPANCRLNETQWNTAALAGMTETILQNQMTATGKRLRRRGMKWLALCGPDAARKLESFASTTTVASALNVNRNVQDETYKNIVSTLRWSEGQIDIMCTYDMLLDPLTGAASAYSDKSCAFIEMDMLRLAPMEAVTHREGPDLGGGPRGWWQDGCVLQHLNPMTSFAWYKNG